MGKQFDYKGYSKEELLKLCDEKYAYRGPAKWVYWPSEVYSFGKHIRNYSFYPEFLPLYIYSNHGVTDEYQESGIPPHELNNDASCMFCLDHKNTEFYRTKSDKPCHTMLSPFVWYRRKNKIKQLKSAKGTLAFPAHSTPEVDLTSDIEIYIEELKKLPDEFQPVCVCMHMHDINKGQHKIFQKHGFPVYTVGNAFDQRFAERFYDILKNFKYTTSNMVGSYTYYSVEMGIPFSLYGDNPSFVNNADPNYEKGELKFAETEFYKKVYAMFKGLQREIVKEQKDYIEKSLGVYDCLGRFEMSKILYSSYFKRGSLFRDLFRHLTVWVKTNRIRLFFKEIELLCKKQ